jgi:hypothetical protein
MKTITFSDKELEFLTQHYKDELSNTEAYLNQLKEILKKIELPSDKATDKAGSTEPEVIQKKRGPKPKTKNSEPKVPGKRGRKPKISSLPFVEVKEPKKRGRKPKSASLPETEIREPKKRGRKPKVVIAQKSETTSLPDPVSKESKKTGIKKPARKRNRKWKGVRLSNWSKPVQLKEPPVEPIDESASVVEPKE